MAEIMDLTNNRQIAATHIAEFLQDHGIHYQTWPVEGLSKALRTRPDLPESDQSEILAHYQPQLQHMADAFGYTSHDVIVINKTVAPNLDELLVKFEKEHHHSEDEVRFIVDGEGVFTMTRHGDKFAATVKAGDLISVPAGTRHYFTLTASRHVKAIRLFQNADGWVAIYDDDSQVAP